MSPGDTYSPHSFLQGQTPPSASPSWGSPCTRAGTVGPCPGATQGSVCADRRAGLSAQLSSGGS